MTPKPRGRVDFAPDPLWRLVSSLLSFLQHEPHRSHDNPGLRMVQTSLLIQAALTSFLSPWLLPWGLKSATRTSWITSRTRKGASRALSDRRWVEVRARGKETHCTRKSATVSPGLPPVSQEILSSTWPKSFCNYDNFLPSCPEIGGTYRICNRH